MKVIACIMITGMTANMLGTVMLIQQGGWLTILAAIISLMYCWLTTAIVAILAGAEGIRQRKEFKKDETAHESSGDIHQYSKNC